LGRGKLRKKDILSFHLQLSCLDPVNFSVARDREVVDEDISNPVFG